MHSTCCKLLKAKGEGEEKGRRNGAKTEQKRGEKGRRKGEEREQKRAKGKKRERRKKKRKQEERKANKDEDAHQCFECGWLCAEGPCAWILNDCNNIFGLLQHTDKEHE